MYGWQVGGRHPTGILSCLDLSNQKQWRIQDFPEEGAPTPWGGAPTYDFAIFSQKLHEIERISAPRGGARPKFYYVDPPLLLSIFYMRKK